MRLIDERTRDGSRRFAHLPYAGPWLALADHVRLLPGAELINFVDQGPAGAWCDFHFRRHRLLVKACDGHICLFVRDPQCPDLILYEAACHIERLFDATGQDGQELPGQNGPPDPHFAKRPAAICHAARSPHRYDAADNHPGSRPPHMLCLRS